MVSNPNGVNLHRGRSSKSNPKIRVSNPNGVNLHKRVLILSRLIAVGFKPQRGKFTLKFANDEKNAICQTYTKLYRHIKQINASKNRQTWVAKVNKSA